MSIAFSILFVIASELTVQVATDQQLRKIPYPFGATILCYAIHLILLITSIWYCGWLFGILLFLSEFFTIIHLMIGWILAIPKLFIKHEKQALNWAQWEVAFLTPILIIILGFCTTSFFVVPYGSLYAEAITHPYTLIILGTVFAICGLARILISKKLHNN